VSWLKGLLVSGKINRLSIRGGVAVLADDWDCCDCLGTFVPRRGGCLTEIRSETIDGRWNARRAMHVREACECRQTSACWPRIRAVLTESSNHRWQHL
jgi:hypothetical protein